MAALEDLIDASIDPKVIIPGNGLCNLPETIAISRHAVELDCAAVLTLPLIYLKELGDDGYFEYIERIVEGIDNNNLKIYLFFISQVSGVALSIELVKRLRESCPQTIVGIKDSSGNWDNTAQLSDIDGLILYPGFELCVIEFIQRGGPGCISAPANLNSGDISRVIELCHTAEWEEAEKLHDEVKAVRLLFQDYAPIPAQKALLAE